MNAPKPPQPNYSVAKSLVFSQFSSTLQWMQQELPKHGFEFRTLSGNMTMAKRAKALREFQNDPPTTIFLLSLRSGAVGINLTQANRVFLMEPAMNPALEAQAIGRVYRLGQRKPVKIIRMQMKDTFESRLVDVLQKKYGEATKPPPLDTDKNINTAAGANSDTLRTDSKTEEKKDDDDDDYEGEAGNKGKKRSAMSPAAKECISGATTSLGHITRDKASLMIEEFDALFGVNA